MHKLDPRTHAVVAMVILLLEVKINLLLPLATKSQSWQQIKI